MRHLIPLLALAAASLHAQSPTDRIRGRVVDDSARTIVGASVYVTRGPDRAVKQASTDSAGRYLVQFENGTGDYLVSVVALGFRTARRRVHADSASHDITADFTLARDATTLAAVKIEAAKPVKASNNINPYTAETGASERWADGVNGQLNPALAGDISSLAATLPGLVSGPNGLSFMGASSQSNLTTLNGMALPAASLPRAARLDTRVTGTTYDPTRGGFAGANIDVRLGPGDRFYQRRNGYLTFDSPTLQATDAIGRENGATNATTRASLGADGELIRQMLTYNVAVDFTRGRSDLATLSTADAATLLRAGVSPDSAARLATIAQSLGIPLRGAGIPADREHSVVTWLGRLDATRDTMHLKTLTTLTSLTRDGAIGLGALAAPSAGADREERVVGAQLQFTDFVGAGNLVLTQTRLAASRTHLSTAPYLALPAASVLVGSTEGSGTNVAALGLGGGAAITSADDRWTLEGTNETIWNARGRTHRFKVMAWARADGLRQRARDLPGRYTYSSLADLADNRPAAFSRTLSQPDRAGTAWNAAAAFSHQWNPTRWFNVLYGLRAEANGTGTAPARNAALEQALGVRTGLTPRLAHLSPRIGFQWTYNRDRDNGNGQSNNPVGTFYRTTSGVVRGGIGEFRDLLRPDLVAAAAARTGLADGTQTLSCVGTAVPIPDWRELIADPATTPTRCTDGSGVFADNAPSVSLFDPRFQVARSWRASLDWNSGRKAWMWRVSGVVSYDLNQPGVYDANFSGTPRFTLGGGDGRSVFVSPGSIDPASGLPASADARRSSSFGRVDMRTSDLRGVGEQFTLTLSPDPFRRNRNRGGWLSSIYGSVSYTWQHSQRQARGFDGAGFGDPRRVEWAPSNSDARHVVLLQLGTYAPFLGSLTMSSRLQSGLPFTPIIQGDVDGDGRSGDRAFVPSASGVDSLSAAIRGLIAGGAPAARQCLSDWAGRVPARNGCRGPWTASLNAQWRPPLPAKIARRFTMSVFFQNVLGGLDQMLHGSNMRGWGTTAAPDPVLLIPRGFDATSRTFRYAVNPRFADTRPTSTLLREPFRVTLDFSMRLSVDYDLQQLRRALEPVRMERQWVRRNADSLTAFYLHNTSDIHAAILAESDSLLLSPGQIADLREADSAYKAQVRAIYQPLGRYLSQFGDGEATKAALDSVTAASKAYWRVFWRQPERADSVLSPIQRELMPMLVGMLGVPQKDREHSQWQFGYPVPVTDPKKK